MHTIESIASKKAQMDSTASVTRKAAAAKASATKPAPTPVVSSAQPEPMAPESPAAEPAPAQSRVSPSVALSPEPEAEPPVTVKSVSLDQLRAGTDGPTMSKQVNYREQPPSVTEPVTVPEDAEPDEVEVDTAALSAWVTDTVGQVGVDRTVTIINTAVKRGLLPSEHKDIMVRLTDRADESQVPEKLAINKVLNAILALQQAMGQQTNPDEAINLIDEANLG